MEGIKELLGPYIGASWSGSGLGPDNSAEGAPTTEAASMTELRDDKVEEFRVLAVSDDMTTPRRIACTIFVEVRKRDISVVIACPSFNRL